MNKKKVDISSAGICEIKGTFRASQSYILDLFSVCQDFLVKTRIKFLLFREHRLADFDSGKFSTRRFREKNFHFSVDWTVPQTNIFVANTQQAHNVETTLIQRLDVESTLFQRCVPAG